MGEISAQKTTSLENQKTFGRECDEAVNQVILRTAVSDSANANYYDVSVAFRHIIKAREDEKSKLVGALMKLRELLSQGHEVPLRTQLAKQQDEV